MLTRMPEIDKHAVAHILGEEAGKPADGVADAAVVSTDNLARIFGIRVRR